MLDIRKLAFQNRGNRLQQLSNLRGVDTIALKRASVIHDRILVWKVENKDRAELRPILDLHENDLFPTPLGLARRMIEKLKVTKGDDVLEPSAGTGNIIQAIQETGAVPFYIEINPSLHFRLRQLGYEGSCADFLTCGEIPFEFIAMNPPFSNGKDIQHVQHAWNIMPKGQIVAIVGSSSITIERHRAFQYFVKENSISEPEFLPHGTFRESGTNVSTYLLHLGK